MPKPTSGCPNSKKHTWQDAWRFQDLENDSKQGSKFSPNFHMDAKITNNDITRGFCTSFNENVQEPWPRGKRRRRTIFISWENIVSKNVFTASFIFLHVARVYRRLLWSEYMQEK